MAILDERDALLVMSLGDGWTSYVLLGPQTLASIHGGRVQEWRERLAKLALLGWIEMVPARGLNGKVHGRGWSLTYKGVDAWQSLTDWLEHRCPEKRRGWLIRLRQRLCEHDGTWMHGEARLHLGHCAKCGRAFQ